MKEYLALLASNPEQVLFAHTMEVIDAHYDFTPTSFTNGDTQNEAGQNNGSCKIFAFAQLQGLDEVSTLACFGQFYREDVLQHPEGNDHANIRNFMQHGWAGIRFDDVALTAK